MRPTIVSTIVYGKPYTPSLVREPINGAREEVKRKRNAACPFGVATLGRFVPVL
ncbi:MAG: hypothetical protein Ct9H90mP22_5020 [Gammaproteobacteria bacterium]|nr:MAG: hypothetical protein Ct9H90mP22_5020 [Gammaproteobacteria bacterium]